jgi:hypothetical protein
VIELKRVCKDEAHLYIFCSWHNIDLFKQIVGAYFQVKNILIWEKNNTGMGDLDEIISGVKAASAAAITNIGSPYSSFGLGLVQDVGVGKFSVYYAPSNASIAGDSHGGFSTFSSYVDGSNSTYEVGFRGNLGVKGLDASLFYNSTDTNDRATNSNSADNFKAQAKYTLGNVILAASRGEQDTNTTAALTTKTTTAVALGYALNKDVTVSIGRAETDSGVSSTSGLDEEITAITVGYNLGPVAAGFSVGKVDNYGNATGDGKTAQFTLSTRF